MQTILTRFVQSLTARGELVPGADARLLEMGRDITDPARSLSDLVRLLSGAGAPYLTADGRAALKKGPHLDYILDRAGLKPRSCDRLKAELAVAAAEAVFPSGMDPVDGAKPEAPRGVADVAALVAQHLDNDEGDQMIAGESSIPYGLQKVRDLLKEMAEADLVAGDLNALADKVADVASLPRREAVLRIVARLASESWGAFHPADGWRDTGHALDWLDGRPRDETPDEAVERLHVGGGTPLNKHGRRDFTAVFFPTEAQIQAQLVSELKRDGGYSF